MYTTADVLSIWVSLRQHIPIVAQLKSHSSPISVSFFFFFFYTQAHTHTHHDHHLITMTCTHPPSEGCLAWSGLWQHRLGRTQEAHLGISACRLHLFTSHQGYIPLSALSLFSGDESVACSTLQQLNDTSQYEHMQTSKWNIYRRNKKERKRVSEREHERERERKRWCTIKWKWRKGRKGMKRAE